MTHRSSCPRPWEARRQGERDFDRYVPSWENPYARKPFEQDHCREAERAWENGRHEAEMRRDEERQAEQRSQRAAEQRRRDENYRREERWADERRQQEEEVEYWERIEEEEGFWLDQAYLMDVRFDPYGADGF